eukprot:TRINITY_DN3628_c0_g3_i2.p1 TRINITY_DN3628_c0_g3~~TRINITY_DN3628_c0_g3_i2.p1  ORF type:complete len:258 (+),score=60.61 TRINITY_DN3628_c0_g3_i2:54-827(+)
MAPPHDESPGALLNNISTIAIIIAMEAEAQPLVELLDLKKTERDLFPPGAPWVLFAGSHDGITIDLLIPGHDTTHGVNNVSTVPAAVLAYAAITTLKPDLIINAGTAGGFKRKGAAIGDVYVATHFAHHDRRIPLPGYDKFGVGELEALPVPHLVKALGLKEGRLSTGNSLDMSEQDAAQIERNDASVKDMEGAAIAWVAATLKVPVLAIKAVTDIVDGDRPTVEEFLENLEAAALALQRTLPQVVSFVGGKTLQEL